MTKIEYAEFIKEMRANELRIKRMLIDDKVKTMDWGHLADRKTGAEKERFLRALEQQNNIKIYCKDGVYF